ncbi:OmpA family protein [Ferruginibacter lapsinanis]|uniref:OmpA family protein n=1 Tax=Ferruginibacter lapsinanis TaxID=563172 RepID=UPI001E2B9BB1|nr:OmpA family protein [Ferruginibacter lapsinanis]UEG49674.1 OmpA family protein [Ferruginibacter lapsinanis]
MKNRTGNILLTAASMMLLISSCQTTKKATNQDKGVAIGAIGGGIIGGILGNNVGNKNNTALGVLIGGVVGGVAGGIIGNKMDRQAEKIKTEIPGAKVERIGEGINVTFDENNPDGSKAGVYFETNKYAISANSKLALDKLQKIFAEYPETNILIEGHTDNVGTDAYNLSLSQRRADAVGDYLKAVGVPASRLTIKWYGESQPIAPNDTDANRALNRRVQFVITANEKMKAEAKAEAEKN